MNKKMLVVTHGDLGKILIDVAKSIIGDVNEESIQAVSNEGLSTMEMAERLRSIIDNSSASFFILATDFPGGSCFIASKKIASTSKTITTVSGLNLSMILSFLTKKDMYNGIQLTEIIKTDGNRAIVS